jgi:YbbR domain-containing protein
MSTIKKITSSRALYIVLACILSVILWLYVASYANTDMETELTGLEIDYIGGDDILQDRKLLVTEKDQQSVSLTILGKRNVVTAINKDDVRVSVDLTDIRSTGVYEKVYTVTFPEGVKEDAILIVKRSPEFVTVNIDKLMTKAVEVRGDFEGSVEEGYMQEPITYEPSTVQVSGPEEIVSHISCAHVVLDRENLTRTVTGTVSYTLLDYEDKVVDSQELSVDVTEVQYTIPIVMVKDIVLTVDLIEGGAAKEANAVVEIKPKVLTLTGGAELLQGINKITLGTIDLASFEKTYTVTYPIPLPNGAENLSGEKEAAVTVSIRGLETKHLIATNITFINVSEGYEPKAITQYKEIVIRGPAEIVALVDYRNVQLVADLSEIGSAVGRYSVPTSVYITGYSEVGVVEGNYNVVVSLEVKPEEPELPPETEPPEESEEETGGENTEEEEEP